MKAICPNCDGELVRRPEPSNKSRGPASLGFTMNKDRPPIARLSDLGGDEGVD